MSVEAGPPPRPDDVAEGDTSPVDTSQPPPLSRGDYEHTTVPSPSSTSVIPAVRLDEPTEPKAEVESTPEPAKQPADEPTSTATNVPEKASTVRLVRIDPWSVTRMTFVTSVALMIVAVVAAAVIWVLLAMGGVFGSINSSVGAVAGDGFDVSNYLGFGRMVGGALVLSAINVVCMTALATIAAHVFNLVAAMLGGIEVSLADD